MKKWLTVLLVLFIAANITGCEALQKKFTRKKKEPTKMPHIYQVKKYEKKPTPELYKKHYAYWMSWQSELIEVVGQNDKKDKRCIEEIIGNLCDMQNMLVKEKGDELTPHIEKLTRVKDMIFRNGLNQSNKDSVLNTLDHEDRVIKSNFNYTKIKNYLKKSFDEPVSSPSPATAGSGKEEQSGLAPYSVVFNKEPAKTEGKPDEAAEPQATK